MARILVIDDDESLLQMMSLMLKRAGHQTIMASNGYEGIEIARREGPDAAIVDVMMPELDGPTVLGLLREDSVTAGIPVVFITARTQAQEVAHLRALGASGVIAKPFDPMALAGQVRDLLDERNG